MCRAAHMLILIAQSGPLFFRRRGCAVAGVPVFCVVFVSLECCSSSSYAAVFARYFVSVMTKHMSIKLSFSPTKRTRQQPRMTLAIIECVSCHAATLSIGLHLPHSVQKG